MSPGADYLQRSRQLVDTVQAQLPEIRQVARWFAETILAGRMVHLFGSGHSRILVEEMWPRYGSFPGFNPIVELSLSFHNPVVGANGQRQAMFLENVPGFAARILRNFDLSPQDTALVASSSGCNVVPIEMAEEFQRRGVKVVAIISRQHSERSTSQHPDGRKLQDFADLVLDTGAPAGDSMVRIPGLDTPVAPGSTVGGCLLINSIKAEVAARLTQAGQPPRVLTAAAVVGRERAEALFEAAYDEHARRLARLYENIGLPLTEPPPGSRPGVGVGVGPGPGPISGPMPGPTSGPAPGPRPDVVARRVGPTEAPRIGPVARPQEGRERRVGAPENPRGAAIARQDGEAAKPGHPMPNPVPNGIGEDRSGGDREQRADDWRPSNSPSQSSSQSQSQPRPRRRGGRGRGGRGR